MSIASAIRIQHPASSIRCWLITYFGQSKSMVSFYTQPKKIGCQRHIAPLQMQWQSRRNLKKNRNCVRHIVYEKLSAVQCTHMHQHHTEHINEWCTLRWKNVRAIVVTFETDVNDLYMAFRIQHTTNKHTQYICTMYVHVHKQQSTYIASEPAHTHKTNYKLCPIVIICNIHRWKLWAKNGKKSITVCTVRTIWWRRSFYRCVH